MENYGYFNEEGNEFIITDPATPRAFDNFIWNDAIFGNLQQTGVGFLDYQPGDKEAVKLFTGIGRICDFDVFGRDHLMSRLIYVRDNDTGEFWNINWEPVCKDYQKYSCTHGIGYTEIESKTEDISSSYRVFIPLGNDPVELWTVKLKNESSRKRNLSIFSYNQFLFSYKWGFDSYGDMIYRHTYFNEEMNSLIAQKHPYYKPHNVQTAFLSSDRKIDAFDGNRDQFVGVYNTLKDPACVKSGKCTNTEGSAEATIGAVQFNLELDPSENSRINLILGVSENEKSGEELKRKYAWNFDQNLDELKSEKKKMAERNKLITPDKHLNRFINIWAKQQTLYGAQWCRWGWNGYRDIVQHGLGVSTFRPEITRKILLEALKYQNSNGLALRGWNPIDEKAYSDSALWLVYTMTSYLKESGDFDFLEYEIPFYDKGRGKVLEHIEKALTFLEEHKGAHGLNLIKFGDWNDSLTAIGEKGRGESVWLSQAYTKALTEMAELYGHIGNRKKQNELLARAENMINAINDNAWDGEWYLRSFDDEGRPVGSSESREGKIFLNTQSWGIISGAATGKRAETLLRACDRELLTDIGYLLLAPCFKSQDPRIGRITAMEPGICENGTVYSHGNVFMLWALLLLEKSDKAYDIFKRITPGYYKDESDPKHWCLPYVYANGYFGPEHRNNKYQMEFSWITGSVAWFYNLIAENMMGIRKNYDSFEVSSKIPSEWDKVEIDKTFRDKNYRIEITNTEKSQVKVNGKTVCGKIKI